MMINNAFRVPPPPRRPIPLHDWGSLLAIGSGFYVLADMLWIIFGIGGEAYEAFIDTIELLPISLATIILFWRAASDAALDQQTRRAWRVLTIALCFTWLGNALWLYYYSAAITPPFPSWPDVAFLSYFPLLVYGILLFPTAPAKHRLRSTFWLDAGTVVLGGGMAVWYFVLQPMALLEYNTWLEAAVALAYPIGNVVTLVGVASISLRQPKASSRYVLGFLAVGLIFFTIGDIRYGYLALQGDYGSRDWSGAMWVVGNFLLLLGAHFQYWHARLGQSAAPDEPQAPVSFNLLPYIAIAIGFGLLLFASHAIWDTPIGNLIIGVIGLTILVVARQIIAVRAALRATAERVELMMTTDVLAQTNSDLEQRVAERTATLQEALAAQEAQARKLEESLMVQQQLNETIAKLSAPVIPVRDDTLVVPLVGTIDFERAKTALNQVLWQIETTRARRVFVDVTGVVLADMQVAQALLDMAAATRLLGAEIVLVGIRPEMAQALVSLGVDFGRIATAATLQSGLMSS